MNKIYLIFALIVLVVLGIVLLPRLIDNIQNQSINFKRTKNFPGLKTNASKASVDLGKIISGGPGKDGIPAINEPKFTTISEAQIKDEVQGILVEFDGERRFYPYNILVWHEIVNDSVGQNHFTVTFCPLCGSAIVFNRLINGEILQFGVSGLLFESNLVMYDQKTESLWSQVKSEAIVGDFLGTKLEVLPMQLLTFGELKNKYSDTKVLSTDTGHKRDYSFYPYGDYNQTDELYFPISVSDKRFPTKEIMYSFNLGEKSVAFSANKLKTNEVETKEIEGETVKAERKGEEIIVSANSKIVPGYFVMWFSWATHNQKDGVVWEFK